MKLRKTFNGNLKAVSPVIATIIIVAIAIVMSIAVAYWMLGLGGAFTRYEKLEFQSGYAKVTPGDASEYTIDLRLKNTGSADATVDILFLNAVPQMDCANLTSVQFGVDAPITTFTDTFGYQIVPGDSIAVTILMDRHNPTGGDSSEYKPGMSLEMMVQTSAGNQYPKVIVLP